MACFRMLSKTWSVSKAFEATALLTEGLSKQRTWSKRSWCTYTS